MPASIRKLDPLVASQIAAGEVVERPASVVKELVENSIDAGADRISIEIVHGGMKLIRVSDNGKGMSREDALLSLERFATSKISSVTDLDNIGTLGFRGEALPSIASCSRLVLETKTAGSDEGTSVRVDGGSVIRVSEKGLPQGTTITVTDLFFNTPARFKFMKSRATERNAAIDTVERLALAWHDISFALTSDGRMVLHTTGKGLRDALANIFGPDTLESMVKVWGDYSGIKISGFAGLPRLYRRSRDRQLFSVNRRPVKNTCLGWALDSAYAGLLPPKTYPVAVLDLTLEPGSIDVNVHPTKAEIKFGNEALIRRMITQRVREALSQAGYVSDPPVISQGVVRLGGPSGVSAPRREDPRGIIEDIRQMQTHPLTLHDEGRRLLDDTEQEAEWEYLGSLQDMYLVAKTPDSLLIIDQHALAESLAYHCLVRGEGGSQELRRAGRINDISHASAVSKALDRSCQIVPGDVDRIVRPQTAGNLQLLVSPCRNNQGMAANVLDALAESIGDRAAAQQQHRSVESHAERGGIASDFLQGDQLRRVSSRQPEALRNLELVLDVPVHLHVRPVRLNRGSVCHQT